MHAFIPLLSPSFLYHPYIFPLKPKDFSFTCILSTTVLSDRDGNGTYSGALRTGSTEFTLILTALLYEKLIMHVDITYQQFNPSENMVTS